MKSNEIVKNHILAMQAEYEYTHYYAIAIRDHKMIKACFIENADEVLPLVTYCERNAESHGGVWGVRMMNNSMAKGIIKEYASKIVDLCSIEYFENRYMTEKENGIKGNRGNLFETLLVEVCGGYQVETKNAKCTEMGDVVIDGQHIQCKLWNATITTEPQAMRFYTEYMAKQGK